MIINGQNFEQIVITRKESGSLTTEDGQHEVIAILSDDGEWIVKDGYEIQAMPACLY
ncbi:hypothetical protein MKX41_02420 [Paenibacillus sp. FSL R5-0475]|uniref:hypothetical protein n=1 Tax=Paenibacillus sp. FSL R5-0475 TaxID=2921643 RepID=UPI0030F8AB95